MITSGQTTTVIFMGLKKGQTIEERIAEVEEMLTKVEARLARKQAECERLEDEAQRTRLTNELKALRYEWRCG
jgi:chromosome segregation ATPase